MNAAGVFLAVIAPLIVALLLTEIGDWPRQLAVRVINRAVRQLREGDQERYQEEFSAELTDIRRNSAILLYVIRILILARRLRVLESKNGAKAQSVDPTRERALFARYRIVIAVIVSLITGATVIALEIISLKSADVGAEILGLATGTVGVLSVGVTIIFGRAESRQRTDEHHPDDAPPNNNLR